MQDTVFRTELTPLSFLPRSACIFPDKVAVIHDEREYTYREFNRRVNRFADALMAAGLQMHDRVALLAPNTPALLEAHFAVPLARGMLVAINTRLHRNDITYILKHSGARFLFVDATLTSLVESSQFADLKIIQINDTGRDDDPYEAFLALGSDEINLVIDEEDEPISMNYTSGTTGQPKGVVYSHRGAFLNAVGNVMHLGLDAETVFLWTLPMFHCNGWCCTWAVTAVGGTHICLRKPAPEIVWQLIRKYDVTHFNGAPTVHTMLVHSPQAKPLAQPVTVTMGGAPPSPTLLAQLERLNMKPIHIYGLTETYGPITICQPQREWPDLPSETRAGLLARQGQGYVTADMVRVVDDNGTDVPRDGQSIGEVVMRGNNVMTGYFGEVESTAHAFRGGWFHSGDLAVWHPDGNIELRDRQKDIIISGGENISTIEVEQAILRHPAVLECAVVATPDEKWGERPKAFITLKEGHSATADDIVQFCRDNLAHFKCPAAVAFGELPKTSTGKVQKFVLREQEWTGHAKRIN